MSGKKHSVFSNVLYALKNIWCWDRSFYLFLLPLIPISILVSVSGIYFPKILIDSLVKYKRLHSAIAIICIYFVALFILTLLRLFCNAKVSSRKYSIAYRYQNAIWQKYMRTDFSNTDSLTENIKFQNAINDATSNCSPELIWQTLFDLLKSTLGIITYGTIITTVSPGILFLLFISAGVTYLLGQWQREFLEKNKEQLAALDRKIEYISNLSSSFDYAKEIRIFNLSEWISDMLSGFHNEKMEWQKKVERRSFYGLCCDAFLMLIRDGVAYAFLVFLLFDKQIETGDFVFLFGAITGFSTWLNGISGKINELIGRSVKIGYYRDYFEINDKFNHALGCALPSHFELPVKVNFENVSYKYSSGDSDRYALKDINLTIHPGEKIAIVGPNGAGKTTFIKLLCGLYYPTNGTIRVNGTDIKEYNIDQYYTMFSVVFQDIHLLPITIEEFISSGAEFVNEEKMDSVISKVGLDKKIVTLPNKLKTHLVKGVFDDSIDLSGGEKQKLMLARALYKDAPIVILDEPTAALDPIAENEIYQKYSNLTNGKTSVYVSHRLASTRFCDRIIYIEDGKIMEEGSHDSLMKLDGKYAVMYKFQSEYYKETDVK